MNCLSIRKLAERKPKSCSFTKGFNQKHISGVPGGLVGGPRTYQDKLRGFKSHRVHAHKDFFLHKKND